MFDMASNDMSADADRLSLMPMLEILSGKSL
jgi:hypothetical protein